MRKLYRIALPAVVLLAAVLLLPVALSGLFAGSDPAADSLFVPQPSSPPPAERPQAQRSVIDVVLHSWDNTQVSSQGGTGGGGRVRD